ncbi:MULTISPECIES: response regulator transcription factor [unclassified Streptomyces]|uniref:response regulator transcription factor n=1 Tax=unclassified Streptomyces TaxID=2593676 RepID=UPI002E2BB722|nr:response regulator transcription factor [Streptomyces sp. NBC_01439]
MNQKTDTMRLLWPLAPHNDPRRDGVVLRPDEDLPATHRAPASVTVVLADTQPAIRHGVRSVLERSEGISVVGEAATADEVIEEMCRWRPVVLVLDPLMDGSSGTQVIPEVLRSWPDTGILVFSAVDDDRAITSALQAGARGYLFKRADADQILRGIQAVAAGEAIIDKSIAGRLGALMRATSGQQYYYPFPQLTNRERDVLERIAAGKSNTIIARELVLASKTVSNRVSVIFGKLGVADRSQAIVLARDAGLGHG